MLDIACQITFIVVFFSCNKGSNLELNIVINCHVFFASFTLGNVFRASLPFRHFLFCVFLCYFVIGFGLFILSLNISQVILLPSEVSHTEEHGVCLSLTGDVNFDQFIKLLSNFSTA